MKLFHDSYERNLLKHIFGTFSIIFVLQLVVGAFFIYQATIQEVTKYLQQTAERIDEDISYNNGAWDTHRYNADPTLSTIYPIYIFSTDGYVIDRLRPIPGFLDTSDIRHLQLYKTPQTITTPTNQTWRMLSYAYMQNNQMLGVITVSSINPQNDTSLVDQKLTKSIDTIKSKIFIKNNNIDASNLDIRDISYDIAFQVTDKFNRIITKNNNVNSVDRIPNFIDASYVSDAINQPDIKQLQDNTNNEKFLLVTRHIYDANHGIIGVIIVGKTITSVYEILHDYFLWESVLAVILIAIVWLIIFRLRSNHRAITKKGTSKTEIEKISFSKNKGILIINEIRIAIPIGTNQYSLCEAVMTNPMKRWETDVLLEKFGEKTTSTNWRKVYDTATILNKKVYPILQTKLVINKERAYQLNPDLVSKIV